MKCDPAAAFLIDETDKGYYLLLTPEDKTSTFIRREAVKAIRFGRTAQQEAAKAPRTCSTP